MKHEQQTKAREMYFQSNLSKTEIAEKLNVSRRSVYQWSAEGDWETLRTSARTMPSMLAEKCYYLIGHLTDHLLSRDSFYQSVTKADVDVLFKLVKTVNMLKKGSTINEDMETFTFFLEGLQKRDAALADALIPHADTFITCRNATNQSSPKLSGFDQNGFRPLSEKDLMEKLLDEQDAEFLLRENQKVEDPERFGKRQTVGTQNFVSNNAQSNVGAQNIVPDNVPNNAPTNTTASTQAPENSSNNNYSLNSASILSYGGKAQNRTGAFWDKQQRINAHKAILKHKKAS